LDLVLASVSPKVGGWKKAFFVDVLMTSSCLDMYSNCFATPGEEPSPTSGSFNFGALNDRLMVGFLSGIVLAIEINLQKLFKEHNRIKTYEM
jgi:hypothetical protein